MGGCVCTSNVYEKYPELQQWRAPFEALSLTPKDVAAFYKKFKAIDEFGRGTINICDIFDYLPFGENTFLVKALTCYKDDDSKKIDFREFVMTIWSYCTIDSPADMASFAFDLYHSVLTETGAMEKSTLILLAKQQFEAFYDHPYCTSVFNMLEGTEFFSMSRPQFINFTISHPALMYAALEMLKGLRKWCYGELFWAEMIQKRDKLSKGKFLSIKQLREVMNYGAYAFTTKQMKASAAKAKIDGVMKTDSHTKNTDVVNNEAKALKKTVALSSGTKALDRTLEKREPIHSGRDRTGTRSTSRDNKARPKKRTTLPPVSSPSSPSRVVPHMELPNGQDCENELYVPTLDNAMPVTESRTTISRARRRSRYSLPARLDVDQVYSDVPEPEGRDEDAKWVQKAANNLTAPNENYWDKPENYVFSRPVYREDNRRTFPCDDVAVVPRRKYNLTLSSLPSFNAAEQ
mmetsp:Transcript_15450/g.23321  ORF Transcript_15450/g.23321 Transcript_15450/m.23321 type:complete len:462 (-) Transcript_15450:88-1473(-)